MEDIVLNNLGLIYKALKDLNYYPRNEDDFEEAYYCGLVGLIKASKTFDKNKSKSSYLYKSIMFNIINLYKRRTNPRHQEPFMVSLQDILINGTDVLYDRVLTSGENIEENYIKKETIERAIELLENYPNKKHRDIVKMNFGIGCEAKSLREISKDFNVSFQAIHFIRKKVLEKIQKELNKCI